MVLISNELELFRHLGPKKRKSEAPALLAIAGDLWNAVDRVIAIHMLPSTEKSKELEKFVQEFPRKAQDPAYEAALERTFWKSWTCRLIRPDPESSRTCR